MEKKVKKAVKVSSIRETTSLKGTSKSTPRGGTSFRETTSFK